MEEIFNELIVGISVGVMLGVGLGVLIILCFICKRRSNQEKKSSSGVTNPKYISGIQLITTVSDSNGGQELSRTSELGDMPFWLQEPRRNNSVSVFRIPKYSYKCIWKATLDFTTAIGQGAFGPVYKAQMATGETVAVKVLASSSRQGEKEFVSEVLLLARLHHRNLVNLVGYTAERGHHMLLYAYMRNGSLASHLYDVGQDHQHLSWDMRLRIALDVARGLEYLHYGATPPVLHCDIKSSNILLDQTMRARVSDFGLSSQEKIKSCFSDVRGTFGYLDPEYISTGTFTKKSDVYSFGVLLFELITGRSPQQGLLEYVELAAMEVDGNVGWEEIVDSQVYGNFDAEQLKDVADLASKCVNRVPKKRPSTEYMVQLLSLLYKMRRGRNNCKEISPVSFEEVSVGADRLETKNSSLIER